MKRTGIVKFWNGLTFIKPNDASGDVYFDAYAVPDGVKLGTNDVVNYELGESRQGRPRAIRVELADG
jgi:cold shock CspA family protein